MIKPHKVAVLQRQPVPAKASQDDRRFLNKHELKPIDSVRCLQEKQKHPNRPCTEPTKKDQRFEGPINMGHFPNYKDDVCESQGEFFCDPDSLMSHDEQVAAARRLQLF